MIRVSSAASRRLLQSGVLACLAVAFAPVLGAAEPPRPRPAIVAPDVAGESARRPDGRCPPDAEAFARIELFFGLSRPGGVVTDEEFKNFLDARVTPRFPDGLTLLGGTGQFRDASGSILVEGAKLLILLVPRRDPQVDAKVEAIRADYKRQFQQESVLRAEAGSCVSF